jgi:hypothetical protein
MNGGGAGRGRWHARWARLRRRGPDDAIVAPHDRPVAQRPTERHGSSASARTQTGRQPEVRIPIEPPPTAIVATRASWDHTARPIADAVPESTPTQPLRVQVLSLLSDPRVDHITIETCARLLSRPRQDIETTLDAMAQAGELVAVGGSSKAYRLPVHEKERLEAMFRDAAHELGEQGVLAEVATDDVLAYADDDGDEPRLPVTAGLLSLFLPGTGQLLNGDVGRASLVFAVWSLAWITHLSPVWTFVCLYAGAEAFFTAKIRGMERKLAKDAIGSGPPRAALPAKSLRTES